MSGIVTPEIFEELNCRLEAVEAQRNRALTDAAIAHGRWSTANAKLLQAQKELDKFRSDVAALNEKLAALVTHQEA